MSSIREKSERLESSAGDALRRGDVTALEAAVKSGLSIHHVYSGRDHFTALHWAVFHGSIECMQWLLWQHADVNAVTTNSWSPLHVAAIRGQDACAQSLLAHGASTKIKDGRGSTAVHLAATHGHTKTLESLLRSGADVNAVDALGWTATHAAAYHGRLGSLQRLVRWGGKLQATDNMGNLPGHLAAGEGHLPCLKFILSSVSNKRWHLLSTNDKGQTMKSVAEQFLKTSSVNYLAAVEWEAENPERDNTDLAYPVHTAAFNGNFEVLKTLIERGSAGVNDRDEKGATPAHKAAGNGHIRCLQYLVECGADMSLLNDAGETPKDIARRYARLGCVALLGGDSDDEVGDDHPHLHQEEARARCLRKVKELQHLMELARSDFEHLGGNLQDIDDPDKVKHYEKQRIEELEGKLEYERVRRERLESELDQARAEVSSLQLQLQTLDTVKRLTLEQQVEPSDGGSSSPAHKPQTKKSNRTRRTTRGTDVGIFIRQEPPKSDVFAYR